METGGKLGEDAVFVRLVLGGKGDAEADVGTRLIPRDSGNELFLNEPLREGFAVGEDLGATSLGRFRGLGVEEEGAGRFLGRKPCGTENLNDRIHSPTVFGGSFSSNLRIFKGGGRGVLDGEELT